jgi:hypothetical protein
MQTNHFLFVLLRNPHLARRLLQASQAHRQMERAFRVALLQRAEPSLKLAFPHLEADSRTYFQRNFFSILFLAIYHALGIPPERIQQYGCLLHTIRGIVTATDNILDQQHQGAVALPTMPGLVLPNVLLILLQQSVIDEYLNQLPGPREQTLLAGRKLLEALAAIANEEVEQESAIVDVMPPKQLLEQIHAYRGAALLDLAFVVPQVIEHERAAKLRTAREGVRHLGLALQIVDDITDLTEDLAEQNHNYLRSVIVTGQPDGAISDSELHQQSQASDFKPETQFPLATRQALQVALAKADTGFEHLTHVGLEVCREDRQRLLKTLFELRGLGRLWKVVSKHELRAEQPL